MKPTHRTPDEPVPPVHQGAIRPPTVRDPAPAAKPLGHVGPAHTADQVPRGLRPPPRRPGRDALRNLQHVLPATGPRPNLEALHRALLVAILLLALALRLRDPLSTSIIGAEDPYLHMERTWNLAQGRGVHDYPVGFMALLFPLTLLGPDVFYAVARFLPPLAGVASVLGIFLLCRAYMRPAAGLTAALVVAVMPEHISRTNLLFPTAFDLVVLPLLLLAVLRYLQGIRRALVHVGLLLLALVLVHPWAVVLALPPILLYALLHLPPDLKRLRGSWQAAALVAAAVGLVLILPFWLPPLTTVARALARLGELVLHPGTLFPLPTFVNFPHMLTWPILLLGLWGLALAIRGKNPLGRLALLWTVYLLPFTLVDWFGVEFLPHRTVVYLGLGVAVLAAYPVERFLPRTPWIQPAALRPLPAAAAVIVVSLFTVPSTLGTPSWYRLYDQDDYEGWREVAERDPGLVMAGSWQARAGFRALTGEPATYNPDFFVRQDVRFMELRENPDLVVLYDRYAKEDGVPKDFLASWNRVGTWGDLEAFSRR